MIAPPFAATFTGNAPRSMLAISCRSTYVSDTIDEVQQPHNRSSVADGWLHGRTAGRQETLRVTHALHLSDLGDVVQKARKLGNDKQVGLTAGQIRGAAKPSRHISGVGILTI